MDDALLLSRWQFAFTIAFHILFPSLTIGLGLFLVTVEALWLKTRNEIWFRLYRFWSKIFALAFGLGVVTGIVMSFQFGTNWSRLSHVAGDILGPLLGYEVLTAFFLEAGFLGIMLFGWRRVPPGLHFAATCLVSLGTLISMFWILSANSWMHTPTGHIQLEDGRLIVGSWWDIVWNPSFPYRFTHMLGATMLTTAFVVAGVSALHLLQNRHVPLARHGFSLGLAAAAVAAPLQILLGDLHGLNTLAYQPMKIAAMEAIWETGPGLPLLLFAWPDAIGERNLFEIGIPYGASWILTHDPVGVIQGLREVPPEDRPPVMVVFFSFRIMVGIGFLLFLVAMIGLYMRRKGRMYDARWFQRLVLLCSPLGFVAMLAGWVTTEVGRQPWVIQGILRREDALTPTLTAGAVWSSFLPFIVIYNLLMIAFLYYLWRVVLKGPNYDEPLPHRGESKGRIGFLTLWLPEPGNEHSPPEHRANEENRR
ncbi:cytochrome ubiquinol oxidase subunit I [Telmatospirillum sp. J64-1]|uniref:cytochrome ubiquinol oxidase subunit I n=1 Tax=Telmatospirillum sp. J64-1 TaxID=2502183 RepID=UPI00115D45F4|nr:cytochrome ubiquinol oxidase subunit I [Telmatospirillum sp. J64-1]